MIGLGKMGFRMVEHLLEQNYQVFANDIDQKQMDTIEKKGAVVFGLIEKLVKTIPAPRRIIISIPAERVDTVLDELAKHLSDGDTIIETGNSFYKDSQNRAKKLLAKGIHFLDVGLSGGISGARHGACIMIGGDKQIFDKTENIFNALSKNGSYKYLGKSGAGHLVKGYHNFVEYGYMQSLAEGLATLKKISEKEEMDITCKDVCEIWNKGSIVQSRLVEDAKIAFSHDADLKGINGSVHGQTHKEMEKLAEIAKSMGIDVPSCEAAINVRKNSQNNPTYVGNILNAMRNVFGGHEEWKKR
jgi:6-phosphogluconate dehydrogenase